MRYFKKGLLSDDALAGHLCRDGQADIGQHGGCDVGQAAALAQLHIAAADGHERHDVGGVGGEINNLFGNPKLIDKQSELLTKLLAWELRLQDPLPLPRHRYHFKRNPYNYHFTD